MTIDVNGRALHPLGEAIAAADFPLVDLLPAGAFDGIYYLSAEATVEDKSLVVSFELAFEGELALTPPDSDVIALVLGSAGAGWTGVRATVALGAEPSILLEGVALSLRLRGDVLRDVATGGPASISVTADLRVSPDGLSLEGFDGASLAPAYVADTEVVVQADRVRPVFGNINPPGWLEGRDDFRGLAIDRLSVTLPAEYLDADPGADLRLELEHAAIDADGFTGRFAVAADPQHPITGRLFGLPFRFRAFALEIDRNAVRVARLAVDLRLAALEQSDQEKWVSVEVGFAAGRKLSAALSAAQPPGTSTDPAALVSVEAAGVARIGLRAMRLEATDGVVVLLFSGAVTVLVGAGAIGWPRLEFDEFGIGSDGRLILPADGIRLRGVLAAALGPVKLLAEGIGIGSNAAGTALALKPPTSVGMSLAAGPVAGGGYLFVDEAAGQYAGALSLQFEAVAVTAVGVLATRNPDGSPVRMPDGSDGFSLLVLVSAEFTPIQLGFGFTLNGVGGLFGVHRTVNVEALRAGARTGSLNALMFPNDPVGRAAEVVATAGSVFPVAVGRYVLGPMARLGWGTPTLLTFDLGLVLELPAPMRLVVLGRLRMALPDDKHPLVKINMDVLGVIDFDAGEASIDASLYDSQVVGFPISGDMAMRMSWGDRPSFALSAGGFNPRFQPPPNFPALRRLAIALSERNNPRLRLEAYLALTSNTVQFGARLEVYAEAAGFNVAGMLSFDALLQLAPLGFIADIAAAVALRRGSRELMAVSLQVTLSGPRPWRARGKARFKVLFVSASVAFDVSIGSRTPPPLPTPFDVGGELAQALGDPRNWTAQLPPRDEALVTLRRIDVADRQLLAHPLGAIAVTQQVAPLGLDINRYGTSPVTRAGAFTIESVRFGDAGGSAGKATYEHFARAQFQDLTDDEKLSTPSFELMEAGRSFGAPEVKFDDAPPPPLPLGYLEPIIVDRPESVERAKSAARPGVGDRAEFVGRIRRVGSAVVRPVDGPTLLRLSRTSPAALAPTRTTGRAAYRTGAGPLVRFIEPVTGSPTSEEARR
ncbi:DUF6603 domain-containing protein [Micromonospora sp. NBC_01796]|uniref:DUF6603 domain-containing protein n=1 Tax=Micromonospora sp. NBC_01796 TaxID=2975987 RepID=UPI002DD93A74|nr:DUF6603 domain-containing protein [Micromonospora sp. NBC_01796]WSA84316.1 hypothetical protein OIE47_28740 [Micromonospora sp. NBC_01796]